MTAVNPVESALAAGSHPFSRSTISRWSTTASYWCSRRVARRTGPRIVALLGANGAGKTTTLKAISRLLHSERGEITKGAVVFDGAECRHSRPTKSFGGAVSR